MPNSVELSFKLAFAAASPLLLPLELLLPPLELAAALVVRVGAVRVRRARELGKLAGEVPARRRFGGRGRGRGGTTLGLRTEQTEKNYPLRHFREVSLGLWAKSKNVAQVKSYVIGGCVIGLPTEFLEGKVCNSNLSMNDRKEGFHEEVCKCKRTVVIISYLILSTFNY